MNENEILGFDPSQLSVFNTEESASKAQGNPLIYKTRPADSVSEDKYYRATIRIIYNPFDLRKSVLEQQSYWLKDAKGYFSVVSSLTVNDLSCPIFKAWKKCHYAKKDENYALWAQAAPEDEGGNDLFDKRFARYVLIQVLDDKNQPELVNKYLFWKLPKVVWEAIDAKMNPAKEDNRAAIPVMDFLFGRQIKLTVKPGPGKPGDIDYSRQTTYLCEISDKTVPCKTPTGESILNAEESAVLKAYVDAIKEVWESEDETERTQLTAKINSDPNTAELRKIYARVLEELKEWCPNLLEELSYKPWSDEVTARVQAWIDVVLSGNNPAGDAPASLPSETAPAASAPAPAPAPAADDSSDLPF